VSFTSRTNRRSNVLAGEVRSAELKGVLKTTSSESSNVGNSLHMPRNCLPHLRRLRQENASTRVGRGLAVSEEQE
jgi:hypothetical protein